MDSDKLTVAKVVRECALCGFSTEERMVVCPEDGSALMTHKPDPLIGTVLGDRFNILSLIGSGGMGNVYKAKQKVADRYVAVKVLHSERLQSNSHVLRFQQEAKAAAALSHPNVVGFFDYGLTEDNVPFIAMDFVEGTPLDQEIKRGQLDILRAINIFMQTCDALEHAHQKGVVHRDIKPSNLMLVKKDDGSEQVKVLDFGIAKLLPHHSEGEYQSLTMTGEVFGSPQYMSPEQCSGKPLDSRSDVYSLGCVMYESLVGRPPLRGDSLLETISKHTHEIPPTFKSVRPDLSIPEQLEALVMKCLEKEPDMRFPSMSVLRRNLEFVPKFMEEEQKLPPETTKRKPPAAIKPKAPFKLNALAIAVAVVLGVGAVAGVALLSGETKAKTRIAWLEFTEGTHSPRLIGPIRELRDRLFKENKFREALPYARQAVSLSKDNEPGSPAEASDLFVLGTILFNLKDDQSRDYLTQARERLRRLGQVNRNDKNAAQNLTAAAGPDLMIADINNFLGDSNDKEGAADLLNEFTDAVQANELATAESSYEKLKTLKSKLDKPQLGAFADGLRSLAAESSIRGNATKAEAYYKEAIETTTQVHGPQSEQLARVQRDFGLFLQKTGQLTTAEVTLLEALACANASLGDRNEFSISILDDLAKLYSEMKEFKKAEDMRQLAEALTK
jgi:serine/threonine protein kinase